MPILTLFLSLGLSVWLITRDCRRRRSVSAAVWIPTMLLMILASRPVSLWVAGEQPTFTEMGNEVGGNILDQLFFALVFGAAFAVSSYRHFRWKKLFAANPALLLFYSYFFLSVLWSGDPDGSIKRICKDFGLLIAVSVIATERDRLSAVRAVYYRCAAVLIPLSIVFIKYFPQYARIYSVAGEITLTGVTTQKNSLGEIVLIFILVLVWDTFLLMQSGGRTHWTRLPWDRAMLIVAGVMLLVMSQSKTALVCTIIGTALILRSRSLATTAVNRIVIVFALSLPVLLFFSQQFSSIIAPVVEALGRNMTFTGRTDIWEHITLGTVNPLIGAGYWNFWGGPGGLAISEAMHTPIPNAHCGYLDIYIDGGVCGLALLLTLLIASGCRITNQLKRGADADRFHRVQMAFLVVVIIYNLSESTFARLMPMWFTALAMTVDMSWKSPRLTAAMAQTAIGRRTVALQHAAAAKGGVA